MAKSATEIYVTMIGRAMRADVKSQDQNLPKSQRDFHAGRREAYLQSVALIADCEVKDIRTAVLGSDAASAKPTRNPLMDGMELFKAAVANRYRLP